MSHIPNSAMPHADAAAIEDTKNENASQSAPANAPESSGLRTTLSHGAESAREAVQNVPTKAWTIGAVVAGVAASVAIGAYAASNREKKGRSSKSARSGSAKRRSTARSGANAA